MHHLKDFEDILKHPMVRAKEEIVEGESYTIISYMIVDEEFWKIPLALECRGITFKTETGQCVCLPLEKFFNVGETAQLMPNYVEQEFIECLEKRDGSMITPIKSQSGSIHFKTKKSFYSDVAKKANENIPENVHAFCVYCAYYDITPIFEFTHSEYRIVINYEDDAAFTLLAMRDINNGQYVSYDKMMELARYFNINVVPRYEMTWKEIRNSIENDTNKEGYVLILRDGTRVKYKTKWYLSMHHVLTEIRERDIAEAVILETVDDMKSLISENGLSLTPIEHIENRVVTELEVLKETTEYLYNQGIIEEWTIKDFALKYKNHSLFSLIMSKVRNKEMPYKEFWRRNMLPNYSLKCVYNESFDKE